MKTGLSKGMDLMWKVHWVKGDLMEMSIEFDLECVGNWI